MSREYLTGDREQSRAYSRAVKVKGGGTTIYLAGIGGDADAQGNSLAGNFAGQVHRVFERMGEVMEQVGGKLDDVVTMTVFITDRVTAANSSRSASSTSGAAFRRAP